MKASDYIALALERKGVRFVFELSGGMIVHMLDSLSVRNQIRIISMHHEQAAAFAVDGCGRMTGVPCVAMATSGPGATNLLTGIGSCYFDSSPAVFITGQVNTFEQKKDRPIRQLGFQETDIVSMARPITKEALRVERAEDLPGLLDRAFAIAIEGRPGPVLIDIPMNIQRAEIDSSLVTADAVRAPDPALEDVTRTLAALKAADRPLVLAGGGVRAGRASAEFRLAIEAMGVPVVTSLMAIDLLPFGHPLRVGMIGSYGNRWANLALSQCDLLLVLGSRLDIRQTGSQTDEFKGSRTIVHVDCEPNEINNRITGCIAVVSEVRPFLASLAAAAQHSPVSAKIDPWLQAIQALRDQWPDTAELGNVPGINPNVFMHRLSAYSGAASAYVVDVGQHQMWAAQSLEPGDCQRVLTSGGMGSMGFALPAAIGAALSSGGPVVVVAGDGGFQCNIQELQTVVHLKLPLKIVVINNGCHGMVRQFQESYFESRYQSTYWGYSAPDFARVAMGYGIEGRTLTLADELEESLRWLWAEPDQAKLLQVMVNLTANAYPKIAFGKPISEMEPLSKPSAMEST
jgi:acetolactate synthase I/II/III large subunit